MHSTKHAIQRGILPEITARFPFASADAYTDGDLARLLREQDFQEMYVPNESGHGYNTLINQLHQILHEKEIHVIKVNIEESS